MCIITSLMFYQLNYTHSSCVWMLNSVHRFAHNMLCRFHFKWSIVHEKMIMCKRLNKRENSSIYWSPFSMYVYRSICMLCSLYVFCVHVTFTLHYNGGCISYLSFITPCFKTKFYTLKLSISNCFLGLFLYLWF